MHTENEINFSFDINEYNIQFNDIFNLEEIQQMQDLLSDATGVASIITNPNGNPITRPSNFCSFCKLIRRTEIGLTNCIKSDRLNCSSISSGMQLKPCLSAGLWDTGAIISVNGVHIANWLIGQVRNEEINLQAIIDYGEKIGANKDEYLKAFNQVPVMSKERFQKIFQMMFFIANNLSDKLFKNLQLKKQIEEHKITNELLQKSEKSLSITLNSIGDGVISADVSGLIVNMNPVAEKLCGWTFNDANGKKLTEVFNIVNAVTGKSIENPIKKVLEKGETIDLAEHTVLISKNGTEYHIADSAAPIKNTEGVITGVVLVFSNISNKYLAEEKLKESERSKSVLLSNLPGIAYRSKFDRQWTKEFVSEGFFKLTGYKTTDIIHNKNISFNDLILPEYRDYLWNIWEKAVKDHHPVCVEYKISTADNQIKWMWEQGTPIYNSNGIVEALEGLIMDITERKCTEEKQHESEQYLKQSQAIAQLGTYTFDIINNRWSSSEVLDSIFGITENYEKSLEGWIGIIHQDSQEIMTHYFVNDVIANKSRFNIEYRIVRKNDNEIRWVHGLGELVLDESNQPIKLTGVIQDITNRKLASEALIKSEEKYRNIFDNVQDVFYQVDMSGDFMEVSTSIKHFAGYNRDEIIGRPIEMLYADINDRRIALANLMKNGQVRDYEIELKTKSGESRNSSLNAKLIYDSLGNPDHIDGFIRDITKRKKAENALLENEEYLKKTQLIANLGNCMIDLTTGNWKSSEIMNSIVGIDSHIEKSYKTLEALIHPDWIEILRSYFQQIVAEKEIKFSIKFKIIRPLDLEEKWIHAIGELKCDANNIPVKLIVTIQDITERKLSAESLRNSEELHRSILNASPDAIVVVEMDGSIRMVSPAALIVYGCKSSEDMLGSNMFDFLAPDDRNRALSNSLLMFNGYLGTIEYKIVRKDGSQFFAEVNGDIIRDSEDVPNGMVFIVRDITDRKKGEVALKSSQVELKEFASHLQNVREEEKIQLAREIHDELGQILIAIKIDLGMMKQKVLKSIKTIDAENILTNFDNLFALVDNTLNTTRKIMTDLRPEVLFLIGFVEALKLYVNNFKERYQVLCVFENTVSDLKLNAQQSVALYRILQESLTNIAKHAKATKVKINLSMDTDKLVMEVTDNGIGFKTNQKNKPNSYGLLGMKERVYILEGMLKIISLPGNGTTIRVEIPYQK